MPHVHFLEYDETTGFARREYEAALRRAGTMWNIVSLQSQLPEVMRDSMRIYQSIMVGPSPLSRAQQEMMAVVASQAMASEPPDGDMAQRRRDSNRLLA